jgi:DNA replication protein DnaC
LLKHPTLDQLHTLGLHGMAKAFAEITAGGEADGLGHHEWLGLLLDREASWRQDKRLAARLRVAKLRQQACVEDVDYRNPRGLDRALFQKLAEGEWINARDNLALIGPTGVGKSWLASALGHKACRDNRSVLYQRVPRLFVATDAIRAFCATWAAPICSFSMTGAWSRSTPPPVTIFWKSSRNATDAVPR